MRVVDLLYYMLKLFRFKINGSDLLPRRWAVVTLTNEPLNTPTTLSSPISLQQHWRSVFCIGVTELL